MQCNGAVRVTEICSSISTGYRTHRHAILLKTDLVHHGWLQIHKDAPGDVLASGRLGEERVERVVSNPHRVVVRHGAVRVDTVLQAIQLPGVRLVVKMI